MNFFSRFLPKNKSRTEQKSLAETAIPSERTLTLPTYEKLKSQGTELLDSGDFQEAVLIFEAAFKEKPTAESHVNLGFALLEVHRSSEAKIYFEQAVKLDPSSFDANFLYACTACADGDYKEALASVKSALAINSQSSSALNLLYKLYAIEGDFKKIEEHLTLLSLEAKSPSELKMLTARALLDISDEGYLKQTLLVHAADYLKIAIELNPVYLDAFIEQGRLFLLQDKAALAVKSFERAVAIKADSAAAHYGFAKTQKILGNRAQAAINAEKAVLANPKHIDAHSLIADIALEKSDYIKAENHYIKIIELEPNSTEVKVLLGVIYSEKGQYQLAIDITRQAINSSKGHPEGHFALGNVFLRKQN